MDPVDKIAEEQALASLYELDRIREERRKERGMDYYIPNANQLKAHKSKCREILYIGGNRAGKTTFAIMELCFALTKKYPDWYPKERRFKGPVKCAISTESYPIIERVLEPKIKKYLPKDYYTVSRVSGKYLSRIKCVDGSTVDVMNLEMKDEAYEGADWDLAILDEPHTRRKYEGVKRGLVDRRGIVIHTMTPMSEPWIKDDLVDQADGQRIEVVFADIRDNKFDIEGNPILLEESIAEFEMSLPEEVRETRIHGKFFHLRGQVYKSFTQAHVVNTDEPPYKYEFPDPVIGVLDPHDRKPHHMIWAYINRQDDIVVDFEISVHEELDDLANHILNVEKARGYKIRRRLIDPNFGRKPYKVGANLSVIQELTKHGVGFFESNDDIELGHHVVRDYLKWNPSKEMTAFNKPKLFFSRGNCVKTIKSMRNLQFEEWTGKTASIKDEREDERQKDSDGADCVRYLCVSKPTYKNLRDRDNYELASSPY